MEILDRLCKILYINEASIAFYSKILKSYS